MLGLILAQATSTLSASDLERIREALNRQNTLTLAAATTREGPVFRVTVHGLKTEKPLWDPGPNQWIRPQFPSYHYDFLMQVTPEAFRASTLYPAQFGIPIGAIIEGIAKHIRTTRQKSKEEKARDEVRRALQELLACRADPSRPGC